MPLASPEDAQQLLPDLVNGFVKSPSFRGTVIHESPFDTDLPGVPHSLFYEYQVEIVSGSTSVKIAAGAIGPIVFVICCSEEGGPGWLWADVTSIASSQADKLRRLG
jgi:hypothetical protein